MNEIDKIKVDVKEKAKEETQKVTGGVEVMEGEDGKRRKERKTWREREKFEKRKSRMERKTHT